MAVVETCCPCPKCGYDEGLTVTNITEAAHDWKLIDLVVECRSCGWVGNSFVAVADMDTIQEPTKC